MSGSYSWAGAPPFVCSCSTLRPEPGQRPISLLNTTLWKWCGLTASHFGLAVASLIILEIILSTLLVPLKHEMGATFLLFPLAFPTLSVVSKVSVYIVSVLLFRLL